MKTNNNINFEKTLLELKEKKFKFIESTFLKRQKKSISNGI